MVANRTQRQLQKAARHATMYGTAKPFTGSRSTTVQLPYRPGAITHAFRISTYRLADRNASMVDIRSLDSEGVSTGSRVVISVDDLPLVLAAIRKVLAGPLEQLLLDAEAHATTVVTGGE